MDDLTVHLETLVVELPAAGITALLAGSTSGLRAAVEAAVLADEEVRRRVEAATGAPARRWGRRGG
jgi:hypothetical protein